MSPELFTSSEIASEFSKSPATDIFALGATLYCMVVGNPPWMANNQIELANQITNCDLVFPEETILDPHLKVISLYLSTCLLLYLSIYLSIYLSPSLSLSIFLSLSLSLSLTLSIYLSINLSPSLSLSIYLPVYLSLFISLTLSIYLSIYLSIFLPLFSSLPLSFHGFLALLTFISNVCFSPIRLSNLILSYIVCTLRSSPFSIY